MLTKIDILNLVARANLTKVSTDYIENILRNFDEKDLIPKEKAEVISKIILAEAKMNDNLAEACQDSIKNWKNLISHS